ncbi:MAG: M20 family metallopeptidase [Clostridia bacterium]|nr:M20 family metallopeptidase [Clostridia bacterium]
MEKSAIFERTRSVEPWMIKTRRALHQIPELGTQVFQTQELITDELDAMGVSYETFATSVVAFIDSGKPGPCAGFRAEMDALPLEEAANVAFRSKNAGRMHACGHDAHMAIALGLAKVLIENRDMFSGCVKIFFQPAEETEGGADMMISEGCLENPYVDKIFALHVNPAIPVGMVETKPGAINASTDDLLIRIHGRSGHGAHPEGGFDAIVCAASVISTLQTIISRNVAPTQSAVIHFGTIQGGVAPNVICDDVTITGTLRTTDQSLRGYIMKRSAGVCHGVCSAMNCMDDVDIKSDYRAVINHEDEAEMVLDVARELFGKHAAHTMSLSSMGADDFGCFIENRPGAYFNIGCANPRRIPFPPLHNRGFMLDEDCLGVGLAMYLGLLNRLQPNE